MIILHYHLFKNAGTSVDAMLKANFGEYWFEQEFEIRPGKSNVDAVRQFLVDRPELKVLSSHTALMPVPQIQSVPIFPILFVRHPLLRLKSAYGFERKQGAATFGSKLARNTDFSGFIRGMLDRPGNLQVRNFQAHRLAFFDHDSDAPQLERALRANSELPFIGSVENYEASIERLTELLRPAYPNFRSVITRANVTSNDSRSLDDRLEDIRSELGDELFEQLVRANTEDTAIYNLVSGMYSTGTRDQTAIST